MSAPSSQNHDVENELQNWGRVIPPESRTTALSYSHLATLRAAEQMRVQRNTTVSLALGVVLLLSCFVIFEPQNAPLRAPPALVATQDEPKPIDSVYTPDAPSFSSALNEVENSNTSKRRHILTSHSDKQLRQRWLEAKRVTAQAQVLQQWLAENR
jgi:hypothetical protein